MYLSTYEEVESILNISEKVIALKRLSKRIKQEHGSTAWYNFIRGVTLYYEGNKAKAFEIVENAFLEEKRVEFCEKLVQMYSNEGNREKINEWIKKRDNLRLFEREHFDINVIEAQQQILKKQLKEHDENKITLAVQYIQRYVKKKDTEFYLKILKRWSSSTPLLAKGLGNNTDNGGGIYVRWKDKGIVIDPGINFIQNMNEMGISVLDVDYVIITHDHIDHNNDLPAIIDIKYQCILASRVMPDLLNSEKEWVNREIKYYIDSATAQHFQKDIRENRCSVVEFRSGMKKGEISKLEIDSDVKLSFFSTDHIEKQDSYGIVLELYDGNNSKQIGYTSDTKYFPELCDYFKNAEYIIANLSEITIRDLEKKEYKTNHLGYQGCFDIVTSSKIYCRYFILSEFWGGKGDIRGIITDYLKNECLKKKKVMNIIPGDVNLSFDLLDDRIKCSECGKYCTENEIKINCNNNCIEYLCAECSVKIHM